MDDDGAPPCSNLLCAEVEVSEEEIREDESSDVATHRKGAEGTEPEPPEPCAEAEEEACDARQAIMHEHQTSMASTYSFEPDQLQPSEPADVTETSAQPEPDDSNRNLVPSAAMQKLPSPLQSTDHQPTADNAEEPSKSKSAEAIRKWGLRKPP